MVGQRRDSAVAAARNACLALLAVTVFGPSGEAEAIERIDSYCRTSWRNAQIGSQDWEDCTQEVVVRLLDRISRSGLQTAISDSDSHERRELNRCIWAVAKRWRRALKQSCVGTGDLPLGDSGNPVLSDVEVALEAAMLRLADEQREILLRWSEGEKIADIAHAMKLSPARVSDLKYKGIRSLRDQLVAA